MSETTLEWFGATTFRLKTHGVTMFLDTWLDRPSNVPSFGSIDDVEECDYIFISHAHFDHLPGADRLAKRTGAIIYGNCEAINVMRSAGVPETQLVHVQGGERIPLFTRIERLAALNDNKAGSRGNRSRVPHLDPSKAACSVHVWPSLHCFGPPGDHMRFPEVIDTGTEYIGQAGPYACTLDINQGQRFGLFSAINAPAEHLEHFPPDFKALIDYISDTKQNRCSPIDGGQLMYHFILAGNENPGPKKTKSLLWMAHLGGYEGVIRDIWPRPDIAIMACAGRANLNGRPYDGSAAQFATNVLQWLGEPDKVIWCLHDESPIPPKRIDTKAATIMVESQTKTRVWTLEHAKKVDL